MVAPGAQICPGEDVSDVWHRGMGPAGHGHDPGRAGRRFGAGAVYPVSGIQGSPWKALMSASSALIPWRAAVPRQERIAQNSSAPVIERMQPEILIRINRP